MRRRYSLTLVAVLLMAIGSVVAKTKSDASKADDTSAANARWTLYCRAISGPDHVALANSVKEQLLQVKSSLKDWYIIHDADADQSTIYYGHYRSIDDPKDKQESDRAQADRAAILKLTNVQGTRVFPTPMFVEAAAPDPSAPPEWDLRNAKGYWTIEIAVYKDDSRRKQAAVDSVREARKRGEEAYYYHGQSASSVCIGAWPQEAITGLIEDESKGIVPESKDPDEKMVVLPQGLPEAGVTLRDRDGSRLSVYAPNRTIVDPSMIATFAKYPTRALNGQDYVKIETDPVTKQQKEVPQRSALVIIPHDAPSLLRTSEPAPTLVAPISPSQTPGAGTLKSIGQ